MMELCDQVCKNCGDLIEDFPISAIGQDPEPALCEKCTFKIALSRADTHRIILNENKKELDQVPDWTKSSTSPLNPKEGQPFQCLICLNEIKEDQAYPFLEHRGDCSLAATWRQLHLQGRLQAFRETLQKIESSSGGFGLWPSYCRQFLIDLIDWLKIQEDSSASFLR